MDLAPFKNRHFVCFPFSCSTIWCSLLAHVVSEYFTTPYCKERKLYNALLWAICC